MNVAIVTITGYLAGPPNFKEAGKTTLTTFSIPVNRGLDDKQKTTWFNITCFGDFFADKVENWEKGDLVTITGEIAYEEYENRDGDTVGSVKVYPTFLKRLRKAGGDDEGRGGGRPRGRSRSRTQTTERDGESHSSGRGRRDRGRGDRDEGYDMDDEIPF